MAQLDAIKINKFSFRLSSTPNSKWIDLNSRSRGARARARCAANTLSHHQCRDFRIDVRFFLFFSPFTVFFSLCSFLYDILPLAITNILIFTLDNLSSVRVRIHWIVWNRTIAVPCMHWMRWIKAKKSSSKRTHSISLNRKREITDQNHKRFWIAEKERKKDFPIASSDKYAILKFNCKTCIHLQSWLHGKAIATTTTKNASKHYKKRAENLHLKSVWMKLLNARTRAHKRSLLHTYRQTHPQLNLTFIRWMD